MSSISRLSAALGSVHNENTLALANINFDFSLFRVEPPQEFNGLGAALSTQRRRDAEVGTLHSTARKLGALFEQLLSPTPTLVKAYGRRVSEISESPTANPRASWADGVFANQVGVDGTAVWAAATSGPSAIAVNLLACMLARIWTGPEAISVWVELVAERKREIQASYDGTAATHYPALAAAQQELTRSQLATWDASARAWIRAADEAKKREQRQLMLIIENTNIPVSNSMDVYRSVIQAWLSAMSAMENLVKGMPQRVQSGAILLGLSAWHLYPDIVVLGGKTAEVNQKDPLIAPGGYLTIGLQNGDPTQNDGVYWSLSLAHLRYYGDPVISSRSAGSDTSRVSFEDFTLAVLGSVFSGWGARGSDILLGAGFFTALWKFLDYSAKSGINPDEKLFAQKAVHPSSWVSILVNAANILVESDGFDQARSFMLVKTRLRRGPSFLAQSHEHPPPVFGLVNLSALLRLVKSEEERIKILRRVASKRNLDANTTLIRYKHSNTHFEYATTAPTTRISRKRNSDGSEAQSGGHTRWLSMGPWIPTHTCQCYRECEEGGDYSCPCIRAGVRCSRRCHTPKHPGGNNLHCTNMTDVLTQLRMKCIRDIGEACATFYETDPKTSHNNLLWYDSPITIGHTSSQVTEFTLLLGDLETAAIFITADQRVPPNVNIRNETDIEHLIEVLDSGTVDVGALAQHLHSPSRYSNYFQSLRGLASAAEIYKILPNATVAFSTISRILHESHWIPPESRWIPSDYIETPWASGMVDELVALLSPISLSRCSTLACVVMFDTGTWNVPPQSFANVMAISSGDSIYVAAPLLCDPYESPRDSELRRIVGNVGRAGIALLASPLNPRISTLGIDTWHLINHSDFDGKPENCFKNTSLHLSFTGFETPVGQIPQGVQDREIMMLETLISVHDRGKWVADIDVLSILASERFLRFKLPEHKCKHSQDVGPVPGLTSIDCWEELIDKPDNSGVVRAHGNWLARLAGAAISVQREYNTIVLPDSVCWHCCTTKTREQFTQDGLVSTMFIN